MTSLSDAELAYHRRLIEQRKAVEITWSSWAAHLSDRYELGPEDGIDEHGTISRKDPVMPA